MSHTNVATNGASLDDCHTNVFVLTELHGLKWVKLGPSGSNGICTEVEDDPVLWAYGKCLAQGQLCVWRRTPSQHTAHSPAIDLRLSNEKELWIFWYSEEPDWKTFNHLSKLEDGSWDGPGGITYEVRTLLFKALHNLIERCLLQREFVRLGRWFVEPLEADRAIRRGKNKYVLAFSFFFFLHGENNVCVSVDVQPQPPVYKLDKNFIQPKQQVVLVPWCLSAVLTGDECSDLDPSLSKLQREWANFFPLPGATESNTENMGYVDPAEEQQETAVKLPKMVDVVAGGVRMKYPSCYVVVVGDAWMDAASPTTSPRKSNLNFISASSAASSVVSPPCSPPEPPLPDDVTSRDVPPTVARRRPRRSASEDEWFAESAAGSLDLGAAVVSRVCQDSMIAKRLTNEVIPADEIAGVWDFREAAQSNQRITCGCPKYEAMADSLLKKCVATKAQLKFGLPPSKHRRYSPFHRRTPHPSSDSLPPSSQQQQINASANNANSSTTSQFFGHRRFSAAEFASNSDIPSTSGAGAGCGPPSHPHHPSATPLLINVLNQQHQQSHPSSGAIAQGGMSLSASLEPSVQMISPVAQTALPLTPGGHPDPSGMQHQGVGPQGDYYASSLQLASGQYQHQQAPSFPHSSSFPLLRNSISSDGQSNPSGLGLPTTYSGSTTLLSSLAFGNPSTSSAMPSQAMLIPEDVGLVMKVQQNLLEDASARKADNKNRAAFGRNLVPGELLDSNGEVKLVARPNITGTEIAPVDFSVFERPPPLPFDPVDGEEDTEIVELYNSFLPKRQLGQCWNLSWKKYQVHNRKPRAKLEDRLKLAKFSIGRDSPALPANGSLLDGHGTTALEASTSNHALGLIGANDLISTQQNIPDEINRLLDESTGTFKAYSADGHTDASSHAVGQSSLQQSQASRSGQFFTKTPPENFMTDSDEDKEDEQPMILTPPSSIERTSNEMTTATVSKATSYGHAGSKHYVVGVSGPGSAGNPDYSIIFPTPPSVYEHGHNVFSPATDTIEDSQVPGPSGISGTLGLTPMSLSQQSAYSVLSSSSDAGILSAEQQRRAVKIMCHANGRNSKGDVFSNPVFSAFMVATDFVAGGCEVDGGSFSAFSKVLPSAALSRLAPKYKPSNSAASLLANWSNSCQQTTDQYFGFPSTSGQPQASTSASTPGGGPAITSSGAAGASSSQGSWMQSVLDFPPASVGERPVPSVGSSRGPEPSPANPASVYSLHRTPKTPGMADLQSPASSASSCIRNVSSLDMNNDGLVPAAHSLVVNVLLCDTFMNIYRDASFDSCAVCACDMSIKGMEMGIYVVPPSSFDGPILNAKCSCGYSAVRHRYLSYRNGLFHEDELDITGAWNARRVTKNDASLQFNAAMVDLLRVLCTTHHSLCSVFVSRAEYALYRTFSLRDLEYRDFHEMCNTALEQGCHVMDCTLPAKDELETSKQPLLSKWAFLSHSKPTEDVEVLSVLNNLLEPLQQSLQNSRGLWNTKHAVEGPLTWRFFHRRCCFQRQSATSGEELCGPEPVPPVLLAAETSQVSVAPYALQFWEKLSLEPYSQPRDVAYVVVAPDSPEIVNQVRTFFRELSKVYETCHLGRHCPITKVLKDGIMRVGRTRAKNLATRDVDDWFNEVEKTSPIGAQLKLYAQVCRHQVCLALDQIDPNIFRGLNTVGGKENTPGQPGPGGPQGPGSMPPPPNPAADYGGPGGQMPGGDMMNSGDKQDGFQQEIGATASSPEDTALNPPVLVIYMINPFSYGPENDANNEIARLASIGLLRCYLEVFKDLSDTIKNNTQLQILPLQTILEGSCDEYSVAISRELRVDTATNQNHPSHGNNWLSEAPTVPMQNQLNHMKSIAFSVYAQSRSISLQGLLSIQPKTLTGFGPSAARAEFIRKNLEHFSNYRLYCPPFVLAPSANRLTESALATDEISLTGGGAVTGQVGRETSGILFVSYCLAEDQRWLFATCTDQAGGMLETAVINLNIPERKYCQKGAVIKESMRRLWDFINGVMATSTKPWRLVIGRLGRLGHGELRFWSHHLSKIYLKQVALRTLKHCCYQCTVMPSFHDVPCILSACLVTLEPELHLRVLPKSVAPVERFGQGVKQCPLSTPEDASSTHILVFPTSAVTQIGVVGTTGQDINPAMEEEDIFGNFDLGLDNELGQDFMSMDQDFPGLHGGRAESMAEPLMEDTLQQQPLALGYFISTAPSGPLPAWFWSACPGAQFGSPVHLRSALLIHSSSAQQSDDQILHAHKSAHPLDSQLTPDVLRYVLESYNALSWLSIDPATGDRRSCLPVHMQALLRLYHAAASLL